MDIEDTLDFEEELANIELPFVRGNPGSYEVLEYNEVGQPVATHNLDGYDLAVINDYYELAPLGAFKIGGSVKLGGGGRVSTSGKSSGSVSGSTSGRTSGSGRVSPRATGFVTSAVTGAGRAARGAVKTGSQRLGTRGYSGRWGMGVRSQEKGRGGAIASLVQPSIKKTKKKRASSPIPTQVRTGPRPQQATVSLAPKKEAPRTTVPIREAPPAPPRMIAAVPRLPDAGTLCGCKPDLLSIRALLEKADLQRTATNEHVLLNRTTEFRKKALRDLVDIRNRVRKPSNGAVLRVLAACGIK